MFRGENMGINEFIKIGNRIKKLRIEKGFSQKEMATITGIPYSTYSNYENNNREPNLEQLKKIATALNIELTEFFIIDNNEEKIVDVSKLNSSEQLEILKEYGLKKPMLIKNLMTGETYEVGFKMQDILVGHFNKLNSEGKKEAVKRVEELTEIPRYTKPDEPTEE